MTTNKDLAIKNIEQEFEKLSNLILEQLQLLDELFENRKAGKQGEIFERLIKNEKKIDKYEVKLDDSIIKTIVLYQPMASDLRRLFAIYHMTINLERVGDLVDRIACTFTEINDSEMLDEAADTLHDMLKTTSKMVNRAILSFINNDEEFASWTLTKDASFDDMNQKLLKKSIKIAGLPKKSQDILNKLFDVRSIIASIERIGDHATNIAEASVYAMSGSNIRHQDPTNE
ncbi:MAG: PhoU domain-containing protein [Bacteroides sp.]|nr:PhoU domain-containing protein [Bacteroides sp.]